jgi:hypothetical protein
MLIVSCVAMALALFFATYEYVSFYHGETQPYKFEPTATVPPLQKPGAQSPAPMVRPTPAPTMTPAPATTAAPTTAPMATPGTTTAPATTPSN